MPRKRFDEFPLFNAQAATGVSPAIYVGDHRHITIAVTATVNSSLTFKFQAGVTNEPPTFSSAQAVANIWDYIGAYDLEDGTFYDGDTGIVLNNDTVANNTHLYLINTDHIQWFSLEVSAWTDGALTAKIIAAND